MYKRLLPIIIIPISILFLFMISAANAQIFTGCLNKGGSINKVAFGTEPLRSCPGNTTQISWNPEGVQGVDGDTGPQGEPGIQGPSGPNGTDGAQGPAGINCWDTNGNNVNDISEDTNNDGVYNTRDCTSDVDLSSILAQLEEFRLRFLNSDFDDDTFTPATGDCSDSNPTVFPGAFELADGIDNNCNGQVDEEIDADGDGFDATVDCNDDDLAVFPGAIELADGIDNNCDGQVDEGIDLDGDGFDATVDCNDNEPTVFPGAIELADWIDNNCDGQVDEGI